MAISKATVVLNGNGVATPPVPATTQFGLANLTIAQHRFCGSTVRTLKKMKDAGPFLRPVDYIALNIPHYPSIIKTPMDFSTIERKLASSNPNKPDPNPENPRYLNADEFVADVRTIFNNALTFNGPDHGVTVMGKRIEAVFDKQLKNMPPSVEVSSLCFRPLSFALTSSSRRSLSSGRRRLLHPRQRLHPLQRRLDESQRLYPSFAGRRMRPSSDAPSARSTHLPPRTYPMPMFRKSIAEINASRMMAHRSNSSFAANSSQILLVSNTMRSRVPSMNLLVRI